MLVTDALDVVLTEAVLEHGGALERLDRHDLRAVQVFQAVTGGDGAGRAGGTGERGEREVSAAGSTDGFEHVGQRAAGDLVVTEVVGELAELVEDEVAGIERQFVAGVVDLLDVALGADGPDDVVGRVRTPLVEPVEALLAHARRQDRHAAAGHDAADRDAAACVVAGARPDGAVPGGIELTAHDTRGQAAVRGEHLVGGDHREPVAEGHDDRAVDARQLLGEHDMVGHRHPVALDVVVPVHPPQVAGVGRVLVHTHEARSDGGIDRVGVRELRERGQHDPLLTKASDAVGQRGLVDDGVGQAELVDECVLQRIDRERHARHSAGCDPGSAVRPSLPRGQTISLICITGVALV